MKLTHVSSLLLVGATLAACTSSPSDAPDDEAIDDAIDAAGSAGYVGRPEVPGQPERGLFRIAGEVQELPYMVKNGLAFFDGDMLVVPAAKGDVASAIAVTSIGDTWPGGVVPYVYDARVTPYYMTVIEKALQEWAFKTRVTFVPRTSESDYIEFSAADTGCYSAIGRVGGRQFINLEGIYGAESTCGARATVLHEVGHALGLFHEQVRPDRDGFLDVWGSNMDPAKAQNIAIVSSGQSTSPYDHNSIMQYGTFTFSARDNPVIERKGTWSVRYGGGGWWRTLRAGEPTEVNTRALLYGDLDGDGTADAIKGDATGIYYMPGGRGAWIQRNRSALTVNELAVVDWNGDGTDDLASVAGGNLRISLGGSAAWIMVGPAPVGISDLRFCDFNGDGRQDAFRVANGDWYAMYSRPGGSDWEWLRTTPETLGQVQLAQLDGDGRCDAFTSTLGDGGWQLKFSSGATQAWTDMPQNPSAIPPPPPPPPPGGGFFAPNTTLVGVDPWFALADVIHGDFDGDGVEEIFGKRTVSSTDLQYSYYRAVKAVGPDMTSLAVGAWPDPSYLRIADVNGDGRADVLLSGYLPNGPALTAADVDAINRMYGETWRVSWNGTQAWQTLNLSGYQMNQLGFGDFDGDGTTDMFRTDGSRWWISRGGSTHWLERNQSTYQLGALKFGDFDGDGTTDVFLADGSQFLVSYSGSSPFQPLNTSLITDVQIGDLDGDGTADVFTTWGNQWFVSYGGTTGWVQINTSAATVADVRLVDLDGDGKDDVFHPTGTVWEVSWGGTSPWSQINGSSYLLDALEFGDFDGDGTADVLRADGTTWWISYGGTGPWTALNQSGYTNLGLGDFDGNGQTDVVTRQAAIVD